VFLFSRQILLIRKQKVIYTMNSTLFVLNPYLTSYNGSSSTKRIYNLFYTYIWVS